MTVFEACPASYTASGTRNYSFLSRVRREVVMAITRRAMTVVLGYSGLAWFGGSCVLADGPPAGRRIALRGYDPVSYFADGRPAKGSSESWYAFDDVVYLFRSAQHRQQFAGDPERYAPQYDGYCAGGISKNYKAEPDPE